MEKPHLQRVVSNPRLVDTHSKRVYRLQPGAQLIASHAHLVPDVPRPSSPLPLHLLPPSTEEDHYCCEVEVGEEKEGGVVKVMVGVCRVNGEVVMPRGEPVRITGGAFLDLGNSFQLQLVCSSVEGPVRRMLPQTPGKPVAVAPPAKPRRQLQQNTSHPPLLERSNTPSTSSLSSLSVSTVYTGSVDLEASQLDSGLRTRLKRIAQEVAARRTGYTKRKPPPPYEQVGNSIGYQMLHQSHPEVTSTLIDSLYPALKELELKDSSLLQTYEKYLEAYALAQEEGARPECMHPADIPSLHFLVDITVHLCSIPKMNALGQKYCPLWMHSVAILTTSGQNQRSLAMRRGATSILSCMHLTIMASCLQFQQHGWTTLGNVVGTPTPPGGKPTLTEPSLMLALSLVEQQLGAHPSHGPLATSILHFLACTATTAKSCSFLPDSEEEDLTYQPEQAKQILSLFHEHRVLRHVMKVPEELRRDKQFDSNYCALVKALVPTRSRPGIGRVPVTPTKTTPTPAATRPPAAAPPRKPQRKNKLRRSTVGSGESSNTLEMVARDSRKKRQLPSVPAPPVHQLSTENLASSSLTSVSSLDSTDSTEYPQASHKRSKSLEELNFPLVSHQRSKSLDELDFKPDDRVSPLDQKGGGQNQHRATNGLVNSHVSVSCMETTSSSGSEKNGSGKITQSTEQLNGSHKEVGNPKDASPTAPPQLPPSNPTSPQSPPSLPTSPPSLPTSPQCLSSPDSLANEVQLLLNELRMPVNNTSGGAKEQVVSTKEGSSGERGDDLPVIGIGGSEVVPASDREEGGGGRGEEVVSPSSEMDNVPVNHRNGREGGEDVPVNGIPAEDSSSLGREDVRQWTHPHLSDSSDQMLVRVPRVSRNSHYYRHSRKRRHGMVIESFETPPSIEEPQLVKGQGHRMSWSPVPPSQPLAGQGESQFFEMSGEFLSTQHMVIEEVASDHSDVMDTLSGRTELLEGVLQLWRRDKGLQATTNALQGCFSGGNSDISLFINIIDCFMAVQAPWTLAVSIVLLPVLRQLIGCQKEQRYLETTSEAVEMIVHRFSHSIEACKSPHRSRRLSAMGDRQQRVACYHELHTTCVTVEERLAQKCDPQTVAKRLRSLETALAPYRTELSDS